jgi:hypothetical protein
MHKGLWKGLWKTGCGVGNPMGGKGEMAICTKKSQASVGLP